LEGETVRAKKIETQQPNIANPNQDEDTLEDNIETLPHPGREAALRQVAEKSWVEKENNPPQAFLIPFKHGFHREIIVCSTGKWAIYYITPEGARIKGKRPTHQPPQKRYRGKLHLSANQALN
jgi:hypothetical protein